MSRHRSRYPYGPSRAFMVVVGVAVVAQVWHALPEPAEPRDTAALERSVYGELQARRAVGEVRCTRLRRDRAACVATLPDLGRARVTARLDLRSGAVTSVALEEPGATPVLHSPHPD